MRTRSRLRPAAAAALLVSFAALACGPSRDRGAAADARADSGADSTAAAATSASGSAAAGAADCAVPTDPAPYAGRDSLAGEYRLAYYHRDPIFAGRVQHFTLTLRADTAGALAGELREADAPDHPAQRVVAAGDSLLIEGVPPSDVAVGWLEVVYAWPQGFAGRWNVTEGAVALSDRAGRRIEPGGIFCAERR